MRYICIKWWPRNQVGDIIERYVWRRYPSHIQKSFFEEYIEKKSTKKVTKNEVIEKIAKIDNDENKEEISNIVSAVKTNTFKKKLTEKNQ